VHCKGVIIAGGRRLSDRIVRLTRPVARARAILGAMKGRAEPSDMAVLVPARGAVQLGMRACLRGRQRRGRRLFWRGFRNETKLYDRSACRRNAERIFPFLGGQDFVMHQTGPACAILVRIGRESRCFLRLTDKKQ